MIRSPSSTVDSDVTLCMPARLRFIRDDNTFWHYVSKAEEFSDCQRVLDSVARPITCIIVTLPHGSKRSSDRLTFFCQNRKVPGHNCFEAWRVFSSFIKLDCIPYEVHFIRFTVAPSENVKRLRGLVERRHIRSVVCLIEKDFVLKTFPRPVSEPCNVIPSKYDHLPAKLYVEK